MSQNQYPCLPIEIFHEIIDALSLTDDRESLSSCAFVSQQFHARVIYHLFTSVAIEQKAPTEVDGARASKRLQDLAQIIDRNPQIVSRVQRFNLQICSKRLDNFSDQSHYRWITEDTILPLILSKLVRIRDFGLNNTNNFFDFCDLNPSVASALHDVFRSPSLECVLFAGISNIPLAIFTHCCNLKTLRLHLIPNFLGYPWNRILRLLTPPGDDAQDLVVDSRGPKHFPFQLEYIDIVHGSTFVDATSASLTSTSFSTLFSRLKTLRMALLGNEDIARLWQVIRQALRTLQHLHIILWDFNNTLTNDVVDFSQLRALRSAALSYKISSRRATWSPSRLCEFFKFEGDNTLEILRVKIGWIGVEHNHEQEAVFQTEESWSAFDEIVTSTKFAALKELKLIMRLEYSTASILNHLDEEEEKRRLGSYMEPLLPKIKASRIRFELQIHPIRNVTTLFRNT